MSNRTFFRFAAMASLVGALHALAYVPFIHPHETQDTPSYTVAARAILHGSYTVPLGGVYPGGEIEITGLPLPPSLRSAPERYTYRSPGYPLFLAALGGGEGTPSRVFVFAAQDVLLALTIFLVALSARHVWGPRVALAGAAAYALDPYSKRYVSLVLTETLAGALVAVAVYCFVRAWRGGGTAWWAGCGAAWGAATLVRPVFAVAVPLAALAALLLRRPARTRVRYALACFAGGAVLLAPWMARNEAVAGSPVIGGYGAGRGLLTAAVGEGPHRTFFEAVSTPAFARAHATIYRFAPTPAALGTDPEAHPRYLVAADDQLRRTAWRVYGERARAVPLAVAGEYVYRAYFLWMAHEDWFQPSSTLMLVPIRALDWLLLALAGAGALLTLRHSGGSGRALVGLLVLYTLGSALIHVEARYTYPLRGIFLTLAAYAVLGAVATIRSRPPSSAIR